MKIKIKKLHFVGAITLVGIVMGYLLFQEFVQTLIKEGLGVLVVPSIFIFCAVYVISFFKDYNFKTKTIDKVAKEVSEGDFRKEEDIKKHLLNKIENEFFVINLFGK